VVDDPPKIEITPHPAARSYLDEMAVAGVAYSHSVNQALLAMREIRSVTQGGGYVVLCHADGRKQRLDLAF
jgi:hypothetical protein